MESYLDLAGRDHGPLVDSLPEFLESVSATSESGNWTRRNYTMTKKCFRQKFWNFIKKLFSIEEFL